jgi:hypothetical protein
MPWNLLTVHSPEPGELFLDLDRAAQVPTVSALVLGRFVGLHLVSDYRIRIWPFE